MSGYDLSKKTVIFGLHLWAVVGICIGVAFVLLLFLISLWIAYKRSSSSSRKHTIPKVPKEIQEVHAGSAPSHSSEAEPSPLPSKQPDEEKPIMLQRIHVETGKEHRITYPERGSGGSSHGSGESRSVDQAPASVPEVSHLGWGHWYTLRELEVATGMFSDENVIGEGGYGIVYHGVLEDGTQIAVKNLLNNRGQAEKEFKVEVEAIGRVRHKNLVRLLGYCAEGEHRMLVYEYIDNGNLEQWLHGDVGPSSPLTWEIRMNIIIGTAKGLLYLHEGLEPKVVHRDIKSSNILLDKQWIPKVSDFGLAKLLGSGRTYVTTRVMGTFGFVNTVFCNFVIHGRSILLQGLINNISFFLACSYVAPEYASTGMLNESSDIYSFGILIMEIISGRSPVDYSRPPGEVNLVDWLKTMVSNRNSEGVLDPKIPEKPSSRALKRTLLVALRCVDPDSRKRPKMGHIIHMLEVDDFPYRDDRRAGKDPRQTSHESPRDKERLPEQPVTTESGANSGNESGTRC
ncbi:probable serine/threonine-protein kinase At1g01540 isoform X1 [Musa acuminata AAA Group]|uniref:probable serine/threonine-protein kinase At1g01540 isoform X1 n=1 Tax=Musa acuminata AAA Group TaxID=214697 RepID=UPI0031D9DD37